MKGTIIINTLISLILLTGCSTFTKMRYSNGYKSSIEFGFRNKISKPEELQAKKASKNQGNQHPIQSVEPKIESFQESKTQQNNYLDKAPQHKTINTTAPLRPYYPSNLKKFYDNKQVNLTHDEKEPRETLAYVIFQFIGILLIFAGIDIIVFSFFTIISESAAIISALALLLGIFIVLILRMINQIHKGNYSGLENDLNYRILYLIILTFITLLAALIS